MWLRGALSLIPWVMRAVGTVHFDTIYQSYVAKKQSRALLLVLSLIVRSVLHFFRLMTNDGPIDWVSVFCESLFRCNVDPFFAPIKSQQVGRHPYSSNRI